MKKKFVRIISLAIAGLSAYATSIPTSPNAIIIKVAVFIIVYVIVYYILKPKNTQKV